MAHRVTRPQPRGARPAACIRTIATIVATHARFGGFAARSARRPIRAGQRGPRSSLIDAETACVVVQNPDVFGQLRDLTPLADAAHAKGALLVVVVTEVVSLGARHAAGRNGRRHRRRRGPVDRQRAQFRRALCRPVRHAREIRAPDAGPPRRRDRRRRRPARLRADALDARAAHPPREGDQQHLHQLRPVRARLHHPPVAARRGGPHAARASSTTPRPSRSPSALAGDQGRRSCSTTAFFNEFTLRAAEARRADVVEALAERGHPRRRAGLAPLSGASPSSPIC